MKRSILFSVITLLVVNLSIAQDPATDSMTAEDSIRWERTMGNAKVFGARTYVSNGNDTLLYRLLKPINYDPNKIYPLVVCLSGGGGAGTDNISQIAGCWPAQILSKKENRLLYPAFVFVPQCPPGFDWGMSLGESELESRTKLGKSVRPSVDSIVFEAINAIEKEFALDGKRRYISGQSRGGFGTWHFILTHPDMFAAAIPICGGGNPRLAQNIVNVPVWSFHGQKDGNQPVEYSRNMIEAIKKAGGNPIYTEFPNAGHVIWSLAYDTPGLLDWLFAQKNE